MKKLLLISFLFVSAISFAQLTTLPVKQLKTTGSPSSTTILYGDGRWDTPKSDTSDIIGIVKSGTVENVDSLRSTDLYAKGFTLMFTRGFATSNDGGGSRYVWDAASTATDDGKFVFKPNNISSGSAGRWEWQSKGVVRASEVGVKSDGTDQGALLSSLAALPTVKEILFDNGNIAFTKFDANGKTLSFENGAKLKGYSGTDTLTNAFIKCDKKTVVFDTSLHTVTNLINDEIYLRWFGGDGQYESIGNPGIDNTPILKRALKTISNITDNVYNQRGRIVIARDDQAYYFSDSVHINSNIEIVGEQYGAVTLRFAGGKAGFVIDYYNSGTGAFGARDVVMKNLYILSDNILNSYDPNANGILIHSRVLFENVYLKFFAGNGIKIDATAPSTGNANISNFYNVWSDGNRGHGVLITGDDANACNFWGLSVNGNDRWGVMDSSFLQNHYFGMHNSENSHTDSSYVLAYYSGHRFASIQDNNINHTPTVGGDAYWYDMGTGSADEAYETWSATRNYVTGGPFATTNVNGAGAFVSCYIEGGQPPAYIEGNTMVVGGFASRQVIRKGSRAIVLKAESGNHLQVDGYYTERDASANGSVYWYMDHTNGMGVVTPSEVLGLRWDNSKSAMLMNYAGSGTGTSLEITTPSTPASQFGLATAPTTAARFPIGLWLKDESLGSYRNVSMSSVKPTRTDLPQGSIQFANTTDTTLIAWIYGADNLWHEWRSGSGGGGTTTNAITFDNSGSGAASGSTFNGSAAKTISYNTIGAQPTLVSGTSIKTVNGNSLLGSGDIPVSASLTDKYIGVGASGSLTGYSNLQWDDANKRLILVNDTIQSTQSGTTADDAVLIKSSSNLGFSLVIQNTHASGYSGFAFKDYLGNQKAMVGFSNSNGQEFRYDNNASGGFYKWYVNNFEMMKLDPNYGLLFNWFGTSGANRLAGIGTHKEIYQTSIDPANVVQKSDSNTVFVTPHSLDSAMNTVPVGFANPMTTAGDMIVGGASGAPIRLAPPASSSYVLGYTVGTNSPTWVSSVKTLSSQYTDASNSGTTETDLLSYTIPANTLVNNGDRIVIDAWFATPPGNSNSKTLNFYFGSLTQTWTPSTIATGTSIHLQITIIKTASNAQKIEKHFTTDFTNSIAISTGGITDTSSIFMKFTGTATATNDITQKSMAITYYPAP